MQRVRQWVSVDFKHPDHRLDGAMVRVIFLATLAIAAVGFLDFASLRTVDAAIQPIGALLLAGAAWEMHRRHLHRPRSLLVAATLMALAYFAFVAAQGDDLHLASASPLVIITASGVLAVALGGRWTRRAIGFWLLALSAAVAIAQSGIGTPAPAVFAEVATSGLVMAAAFVTVSTVRRSAGQGRVKYQRLIDTAPVGVFEADLRPTREWLLAQGITHVHRFEADVAAGRIGARELLRTLQVRLVNNEARTVLHLTGDEPVGRRVLRILPDADMALLATQCGRIAFGELRGTVQLRFTPDSRGTRNAVLRWNTPSDDLRDVIFTLIDVTAQKQAEEALAAQIRFKDQFIASASHELRTPLTAVVGMVDMLLQTEISLSEEERSELLEIVASQGRDAANIVQDLLVAARTSQGEIVPVPEDMDVSATVESTLQAVNGEFELMAPAGVSAHADPTRVRQIVRNLATNAIRYGGPHRRVVVQRHPSSITIEVRDNGRPIPVERRAAMFRPYERVHDRAEQAPDSVGLGLTVARALAELMDGTLVYEHDGTEAVFRLTLPPAGAQQARAAS